MSYNNIESSEYSGEPIEFYEFTRGSKAWRYVSGNIPINFLGSAYNPATIKRSKISENQDIPKSILTLDLSRDIDILKEYVNPLINTTTDLILRRYHRSDPDIIASDNPQESDVVVLWMGRITRVNFLQNSAKINCEPLLTALDRPLLTRVYQSNCPYVLYDTRCKVNRASFSLSATVSSVNELEIQSSNFSSQPDGYYSGGFTEFAVDGAIDEKRIISHTGNTIIVERPIKDLQIGSILSVYAGCDRTKRTCIDKFNNLLNYGGFPYIPTKNPFGPNTVF